MSAFFKKFFKWNDQKDFIFVSKNDNLFLIFTVHNLNILFSITVFLTPVLNCQIDTGRCVFLVSKYYSKQCSFCLNYLVSEQNVSFRQRNELKIGSKKQGCGFGFNSFVDSESGFGIRIHTVGKKNEEKNVPVLFLKFLNIFIAKR
jgi:hypothetical protein